MKIIYSLAVAVLLSLVAAVHAEQGSPAGSVAPSPQLQLVAMNFSGPMVTDHSLLQSVAPQAIRDFGSVVSRLMDVLNKLSIKGDTGALKDGIARVAVVPTPEPSTYLAMASFLVIGATIAIRRRRALKLRA